MNPFFPNYFSNVGIWTKARGQKGPVNDIANRHSYVNIEKTGTVMAPLLFVSFGKYHSNVTS